MVEYLKILRTLLRDRAGATVVEYGLIVSLIVLSIIVSLRDVADETNGLWATVSRNVDSVMGSGS